MRNQVTGRRKHFAGIARRRPSVFSWFLLSVGGLALGTSFSPNAFAEGDEVDCDKSVVAMAYDGFELNCKLYSISRTDFETTKKEIKEPELYEILLAMLAYTPLEAKTWEFNFNNSAGTYGWTYYSLAFDNQKLGEPDLKKP